ncbi:MAG TPA: hypothetical protein VG055_15265 [Planctomycetaceae bacterium]|jgi:hypothetical protein|nr:hypothetical protein [Planctomycetaceae bacterium]
MTTSKTIASILGPTLIAVAVSEVVNISRLPDLVEQASHDVALIYVSGILLFIAGIAIVRAHNCWTGGWPVLVTIFGWLILLGGLARMVFPFQLAELASQIRERSGVVIAMAGVLLVAGAFLSFNAYRRE